MAPVEALLFDLYGTLLSADTRSLHRELPRILGVSRRAWLELVRHDLLLHPFDAPALFAHHICDALVPGHSAELEARCVEVVSREIEKVTPMEGVLSLLSFLKRRGFKLGLLSNLSSSYKEPVARYGMAEMFDTMFFSCDEGIAKPDRRAYELTCQRMGVPQEQTLMVGDSLPNDVEQPIELGMRAVHVAGDGALHDTHSCVRRVDEVGWMALDGQGASERLLQAGSRVMLAGNELTIRSLHPVSDAMQGRYNLVYRASATTAEGEEVTVFCKRFLLPASAHVEELAYRMHAAIGLSTCKATVNGEREPFLVISSACGVKWEAPLDEALAYELGRHHVFAYLFANADMRPRNAFVERGATTTMTMVDLEHCFFNLVLETTGLEDPEDPATIDALTPDEVKQRLRTTVLSQRAMRRARRTFIDTEQCPESQASEFRRGFVDLFADAQAAADRVCEVLRERVLRAPHLIIGTQQHRRAMSLADVEDIRARLRVSAEEALSMIC